MSQVAEFHAAILQNLPELDSGTMQQWIGPHRASLRTVLSQVLTAKLPVASAPESSVIVVPPDRSFVERMVTGHYEWTSSNLTEARFPVTANQVGEWEWKLFHFDQNISSDEAIRLMKKDGYDAGQIGHILAFGEKYSGEQRKYPIIGLGSVAKIVLKRDVPVLWRVDGRWQLGLRWYDTDWNPLCRFLGVRPHSVALSLWMV